MVPCWVLMSVLLDVTFLYLKDFWSKAAESFSTESSWKGESRTSRYSKKIFTCFPTLYGKINLFLTEWMKYLEWYILIRLINLTKIICVCAEREELTAEGASGPERGANSAADRVGEAQRMWPRSCWGDE